MYFVFITWAKLILGNENFTSKTFPPDKACMDVKHIGTKLVVETKPMSYNTHIDILLCF